MFDKKLSAVRHYIRYPPLGLDREFNRYWFISEDDPRVLIEKHSISSGSTQWAYYSTKEEIDELLTSLDTKGKREFALKESIQKKYSKIVAAMNKRNSGFYHEPIRRSERVLRTTTVKQQQPSIVSYTKPFILYL